MKNRSRDSSFDSAAPLYDDDFTFSEIGKLQRDRVYYWLSEMKLFEKSKRVFEINCGTGYDAQHFFEKGLKVVATDASLEMIKVSKSNRSEEINFYPLKFNEICSDQNISNSDFVFSNFGGLNCLCEKELFALINDLAEKQSTGNKLAMVIMPKFCVTEDIYLMIKGRFSQILRRSRAKYLEVNVEGEVIRTYYHSPKRVKTMLTEHYKVDLVKPIAHFLPPSYLEPFFKKNKWLLKYLNFMESTFGGLSSLASNADHYILIAERK